MGEQMKNALVAAAALIFVIGARAAEPSCDREMEVLALRKTAGVFSEPQNLVDKPIFHQALSPSERRPRAELIRVANSYFEGMEAGTDKNTPFDKDCQRIENGVITSNDPASKSPITRMSCGAQFATGFTKVITRVQERRFPVVDEERGLVLSIIRFDHSGKNKTIAWAKAPSIR
jgi:hypothetical protein